MTEKTISDRLVHFSKTMSYDSIPHQVIQKTKLLVLDTIGVCVGSARMDFGYEVLQLVESWGGRPDSRLIGSCLRVPAHAAAFCNGVLGHGQDYDDTHTESVVHPSAALVPVALALAERDRLSGRDMLALLAVGLETSIRLAMPALNAFHLRGFHTTSICCTFAAALMAARSAGASPVETLNALGVAGSFTSGLLQCVPAASSAKRLHAGWAGLAGLVAADLARHGFTGPSTVFEGKLGVYNSFLRDHPLDLDVIFRDIGSQWEILNIRPKLYPCCHYLQSFIDCAAMLRRQDGVEVEQIESIHCDIAAGAVNMVCDPWERKLKPHTGYDARFSLPHAVSVMLIEGKAGVHEFSEEVLGDPRIEALSAKVSYTVNPAYAVKDMPGRITVALQDGRRFVREVPEVRGDTKNPISQEEILEKFGVQTARLGGDQGEALARLILTLDELAAASEVMDMAIPRVGTVSLV